MARFHLRFKNFRQPVIEAAQALFEAKPWREENAEQRVPVAQAFIDAIATAYEVPTARFQIGGSHGSYEPAVVLVDENDEIESIDSPVIELPQWSISNLLIAVRTHLLANGIEPSGANPYEDPQSWAYSLFYAVKPAMFRARVREGRIGSMTARDTYTSESWAALVAQGKADPWSGQLIEAPEVSDLPPSALDGDEDDNLPDEEEWDGEGFDPEHDDAITADEDEPADEASAPVGLDSLGIVALRKLSRGKVQGGYSLSKPDLIAALRSAGVDG